MRLLVLASAPLLERHAHKMRLLEGLVGLSSDPADVMVVFDNSGLVDQLLVAARQGGLSAALGKMRGMRRAARDASADDSSQGSLASMARSRGCAVVTVARLDDALNVVREHAPALGVNLGVSFVPKAMLDTPSLGVLGLHYAQLPRLRGGDTIRWSVLLGAPLEVSVLKLTPELDLGVVVGRRAVALCPGDTVDDLRSRFQDEGSAAMLDAARAVAESGELRGEQQSAGEGSTFYRMGSYLRGRVDGLLGSSGH